MADGFLETEEQEARRLKKYFDRLQFVADSDDAYPTKCPCGERMVEEITNEPAEGKRYLTCKAFEGDGLHFRKPWELAMIEEVARLQGEVDGFNKREENLLTRIETELANNAKEIAQLKELVGRLVDRIEKCG